MKSIEDFAKWFDENIEEIRKGFIGENIVREYIKEKKSPFMQVDLIYLHDNKYYVVEVKSQEKYLKNDPKYPSVIGPFDGHGLPKWQIDARLKFQKETGVEAIFVVFDTEEKVLYWQSMSKLMETVYHQTKGKKPRIIFDIKHFFIIPLNIKF